MSKHLEEITTRLKTSKARQQRARKRDKHVEHDNNVSDVSSTTADIEKMYSIPDIPIKSNQPKGVLASCTEGKH